MGGHKRLGGEGGGGSHAKRRYVAPTPGVCELSRGMRGVLITCDTHLEHKAIKEAYRLLDDLAGGGAAAGDGGDGGDDGDGGSASGTAGDKLAAELAALKEGGGEGGGSGGGGTAHAKRFSVAQTGCAGTVLLRFSEEADDPTEIASRALGEAQARGESSAPHVIRLLPVQAVCGATPAAIVAALQPLLAPLAGFGGTFAVQWRRRHNTAVDKESVIREVAAAVHAVAPKATVNLRAPSAAVVIEVIKSDAAVSVLPRWAELKAYNLRECARALPEATAG
mmetsp:Transcript_26796/g.86116  ORF Transcript_26796/g.86116 Transcript_26796/m.86116 type:complete len:280 (+) Transcript_26796:3-842(+)